MKSRKAIFFIVFIFCSSFITATNGIFPISVGVQGGGRAGVDFGIGADTTSIGTNPGGLGFLHGKMIDFSFGAFFPTIEFSNSFSSRADFETVAIGYFSMAWDYPTQTLEVATDPFIYAFNADPYPSSDRRNEGQGTFEFSSSHIPGNLDLQIRGKFSELSNIRIYGYISTKVNSRLVFSMEEKDYPPLANTAKIVAFTAKFKWYASKNTTNAKAMIETEQMRETVILSGEGEKWHSGYIAIAWNKPFPPAFVNLFVIPENSPIKIKNLEMTLGYRIATEYHWKTLPHDHKEKKIEVQSEQRLLKELQPQKIPDSSIKIIKLNQLKSLDKKEVLTKIKVLYHYKLNTLSHGRFLKVDLLKDKEIIDSNLHLPPYATIDRQKRPLIASSADHAISYPERSSGFKFGFGFLPQAGSRYTIPIVTDLFPEGLDNKSDFIFASLSPAFAYRFNDRFSIGATLNLNIETLELDGLVAQDSLILQGETIIPGLTFGETLILLEGVERIRGEINTGILRSFGVGGRVGFMWRITDRLSFGAVYAPKPWMQKLKGKATIDFTRQFEALDVNTIARIFLPDNGNNGITSEYDFEMALDIPQRAGAGISYLFLDNLLIGVDFQWIDYSDTFNELKQNLTGGESADLNTLVGSSTVNAVLPVAWNDQYVIAVGVVWQPTSRLILRTGYSYATNPVEEEFLNPQLAGILQHHITVGGSYHLNSHVTLSAAFEYALPANLKSGAINNVNPDFANSELDVEVFSVLLGAQFRF